MNCNKLKTTAIHGEIDFIGCLFFIAVSTLGLEESVFA